MKSRNTIAAVLALSLFVPALSFAQDKPAKPDDTATTEKEMVRPIRKPFYESVKEKVTDLSEEQKTKILALQKEASANSNQCKRQQVLPRRWPRSASMRTTHCRNNSRARN